MYSQYVADSQGPPSIQKHMAKQLQNLSVFSKVKGPQNSIHDFDLFNKSYKQPVSSRARVMTQECDHDPQFEHSLLKRKKSEDSVEVRQDEEQKPNQPNNQSKFKKEDVNLANRFSPSKVVGHGGEETGDIEDTDEQGASLPQKVPLSYMRTANHNSTPEVVQYSVQSLKINSSDQTSQ